MKQKDKTIINELDKLELFEYVDPTRYKKPFIKTIAEKFKRKFGRFRIVCINMELVNGKHKTFTILEKNEGFKYRKKKYLFDQSLKYYNETIGLFCYDYHEDLCIPIKRQYPINEIKGALEDFEDVNIDYGVNPKVLERFEVSKIAEGILAGQKLAEEFKVMRILMYLILFISAGTLIFLLFKSGALQEAGSTLGLGGN